MRESPVTCRYATLREFASGRHRTFNDSAVCDRCAALSPGRARDRGQGAPPHPAPTPLTHQERAARNERTARAVDRLIEATVPGAGASRGTASTGPGSFPRVLP